MQVESKLPDVGVTIFSVMSALAAQCGAVNLSQGFPDFDVNPELIDRVRHHMAQGSNQYAPMPGVPLLREKIRDKVRNLYGRTYDPATEITVTSGATEGIFAAITAVVAAGDEVIVVEPAYDSYVPAIRLAKGVPVYVKLKYPDYHVDWNEVRDAVTPKTRLIILNSPHNPTGMVLSPEDLAALREVVRDTGIMILSDEVYEHIVFDGVRHQSMAMDPELADRSFVISSFGKTYHNTGWKIGYCLAPRAMSAEIQKIHQYLVFSSNTPVQCAIADIMDQTDLYLGLGAFYQEKRDLFLKLMEPSRFKPLPCRGTYFQMLDYSGISDMGDEEFARWMTREKGVAAIPPSFFYQGRDDHKVLRFCFAKRNETLEQAAEALCRI